MKGCPFGERPRLFVRFFRLIYAKLVRINDSPQKIAIGFGLGVFTGILPFAGPVAAFVLASLFRVNRASALLGSLITNTWLSWVTFALSIKIGSSIIAPDWPLVRMAVGYLLIAGACGMLAYLVGLVVSTFWRRRT